MRPETKKAIEKMSEDLEKGFFTYWGKLVKERKTSSLSGDEVVVVTIFASWIAERCQGIDYKKELEDLARVADVARCEYEASDHFCGAYDLTVPADVAMAELMTKLMGITMALAPEREPSTSLLLEGEEGGEGERPAAT